MHTSTIASDSPQHAQHYILARVQACEWVAMYQKGQTRNNITKETSRKNMNSGNKIQTLQHLTIEQPRNSTTRNTEKIPLTKAGQRGLLVDKYSVSLSEQTRWLFRFPASQWDERRARVLSRLPLTFHTPAVCSEQQLPCTVHLAQRTSWNFNPLTFAWWLIGQKVFWTYSIVVNHRDDNCT